MSISKMVNWAINNPRELFKFDGVGAIVSAFFLGFVLVKLESYFGIPSSALYLLAILPCFFLTFDLFCYFNEKNKIKTHLTVIALINLLYCCLSIGLAIWHIDTLTYLGWIYIVLEVLIIIFISMLELKVARLLTMEH